MVNVSLLSYPVTLTITNTALRSVVQIVVRCNPIIFIIVLHIYFYFVFYPIHRLEFLDANFSTSDDTAQERAYQMVLPASTEYRDINADTQACISGYFF